MAEIKIVKDELARQITELRKLSQSIGTCTTKGPIGKDNGSSTTEAAARALWIDYINLKSVLKNLIDNSTSFYQHALNTMVAADNTVAQGIDGK